MAKQVVDYRQGSALTGDSGERGNSADGIDAIKPFDDGERAVASVLDRPGENLRQRTETMRGEMEQQKYLQDSDFRYFAAPGKADGTNDGTTTWPSVLTWAVVPADPLGRYTFTVDQPIVVAPMNTPITDLQETKDWGFPLAVPTATLSVTTNRRSYSGANWREIVWVEDATAHIVGAHGVPGQIELELTGEDDHILTVTIRDDGFTTAGDIFTAFTTFAAWLSPAGFIGTVVGNLLQTVVLADIPVAELDYIMSATFERELHYLPVSTFSNFFAVEDPPASGNFINRLEEGDAIGVVWEYFIAPGGGTTGRCQAIPANANTLVLYSQLFKYNAHPEYIPLATPLCRRVKNDLIWFDGTVIPSGPAVPIRMTENGYTVNRIYSAPSTVPITMSGHWYGDPPPAWATVQAALDGILNDLGDSTVVGGASKIGMPATMIVPVSLGFYTVPVLGADIGTIITQILTLLATKASLDLGGPAYVDPHEEVSGRWWFQNHAKITYNKALLRTTAGDGLWNLVYRNNGGSETAGDITWDTLSVYEKCDGSNVSTFRVCGGDVDGAAGHIHTPAAGKGPVFFEMVKNDDAGGSTHTVGYRYHIHGPAVLSPTVAGDWDYLQTKVAAGWYFDITEEGTLLPVADRVVPRRVWDIQQIINQPVALNDTYIGLSYDAYVQGATEPAADQLHGVFVGRGDNAPAILYNDVLFVNIVNAVYDNVTTLFSSITHGSPSSAVMIYNNAVYAAYKAPTAGTWTLLDWDVYTEFGQHGIKSKAYSLASLADNDTADTGLPDTLCGLFVIAATFDTTGRKTALIRIDSEGLFLVSGNETAPGTAVWTLTAGASPAVYIYLSGGTLHLHNDDGVGHAVTTISIAPFMCG